MLSLLVATAATGLLVGCNIVVPVAYVLEGPGTIPAAYELRETTTAVFVATDPAVWAPVGGHVRVVGDGRSAPSVDAVFAG